jgi:hypothetical protein
MQLNNNAFKTAKKLHQEGKTYEDISKLLCEQGYKTISGQPVNNKNVSALMLEKGYRVVSRVKGYKAPRKNKPQHVGIITQDRKALASLILDSDIDRRIKLKLLDILV